jgi:serine/threonine protein kinase
MNRESDHADDGINIYPITAETLKTLRLSAWHGNIFYTDFKPLGKGGKAFAFTAKQQGGVGDGATVVIKIPNVDVVNFTQEQVKDRLNQLQITFRVELDLAKDLNDVKGVAAIIGMGIGQWRILHRHPFDDALPFSVYRFVSGEDLDDWCVRLHSTEGKFLGIRDPVIWTNIAKQILRIMQSVHIHRIIHGDLWPKNIRVDEVGNITIIDFGECWKLDVAQEAAADFVSSKKHNYLAPERVQSESNQRRKWYTPADIYSIGGILFYLATGQSPPTPFSDQRLRKNREIKDEIIDVLMQVNLPLYHKFPGIIDIISMCLHPKVEDRVSRITPILNTLDLFSPLQLDHPNPIDTLALIENGISELNDSIKELKSRQSTVHPVLQRLVLSRIQQLQDEIAPLASASNFFVLEGDRETHINGLITCLDTLWSSDEILAVTSSQFWKPGNFGPYGRLLSKVITAMDRGVKVSWVILTHIVPTEIDREVLTYHKKAIENYCKLQAATDVLSRIGKDKPFFIGFCPKTPDDIDQMRKARDAFILLRHQSEWLLVAPDYRIGDYGPRTESIAVETTVTSLRIWADARRTGHLIEKHAEYLADAISVLTWEAKL